MIITQHVSNEQGFTTKINLLFKG